MEPVTNKKLMSLRGVLQDLRDKPELGEKDYLKADYVSSPQFK